MILNHNSGLLLFVILVWVPAPAFCAETFESGETAGGQEYTVATVAYKKVGHREILADVYFGAGSEKRPTVVWIHGGGLIFGSRKWLPPGQLERYLKAGYVVISIDHRLAPETRIPEIIEDLKDAYEWTRSTAVEKYPVDPDRIATVGHSSGGYLALMSGFVWDPPPKALVSVYGFGDITGDWSALPNPHFNQEPEIQRSEAIEALGDDSVPTGNFQYEHNGRPKFFRYTKQQGTWLEEVTGRSRKDALWFASYEPVRNITSAYPPTLLVHGMRDTDVPFQQSLLMAEAMSGNGVSNKAIINEQWEHLFDLNAPDDPDVEAVLDEIAAFLKENLR